MKKSPLPLFVLALAPLSISITALEAQAFPGKKEYTVTIAGDDAKALYERLEKKEFGGDGDDKRLITKIGQNVLCTREKLNKNPVLPKYEYKCALSFLIETGELHEMYPIGEDDSEAGLKEDEDGYQGRSVNVKAGGGEATFTIHGIQAQELFDGMTKKEEPARIWDGKLSPVDESETVDTTRKGQQEGTTVLVKKGIHVICFRATFTLAPVTECVVTLEPKPGKAKLAGDGGMNETKPKNTPNEPTPNPQDGGSGEPSVPPTLPGGDGTSGGSTPTPQDGGSGEPSVTPATPGGDGASGGSTPAPAPTPQDGGAGEPIVTPTPPGGDGTSDGDKTPKKE